MKKNSLQRLAAAACSTTMSCILFNLYQVPLFQSSLYVSVEGVCLQELFPESSLRGQFQSSLIASLPAWYDAVQYSHCIISFTPLGRERGYIEKAPLP